MALTNDQEIVREDVNELETVNSPIEEEKSVEEKIDPKSDESTNEIFDGDIDLSATRKKRFRINGDNNSILELNTSDMSVITRLQNLYPKLQKLSQEASLLQVDKPEDDDKLKSMSQALVKIDVSMRQIVDDIFQSNVSEVCAPSGSMFDPFNGDFRFEHIISTLSKLYKNNLEAEFKKVSEKMKKHTQKYTKGR